MATTIRTIIGILLFGVCIYGEGDSLASDATAITFSPAEAEEKPYMEEPNLPSGSKEFSVDLPQVDHKDAVSVEDFGASPELGDNVPAFLSAIAYCKKIDAGKLIVPQGVYHFTSNDPLVFDDFTDFIFDGQGSEFIFCKPERAILAARNCNRIMLKDFSIDWDWDKDPLASVAKVISVGDNSAYVDLEFIDYAEFPRRDVSIAFLRGIDPVTMKHGTENGIHAPFQIKPSFPPAKYEWLSSKSLRLFADDQRLSAARPDDLIRVAHYYYRAGGIYLQSNTHLTMEDVTIYSCPGFGIMLEGMSHHCQFLRTRIIQRPGTTRPITCTADHFFSGSSQGYIKIDGCEFSLGGDDAINIHDLSAFASRNTSTSIVTSSLYCTYAQIGDPIEFRNADGSPTGITRNIKSMSSLPQDQYEITFDGVVPEQPTEGFLLFNWRYNSDNIIIRNSFFHFGGRVMLQCRNVTFENNRLDKNGWVRIESGYLGGTWSEGYGANNVVIRNNVFDAVNYRNVRPQENYPGGISIGAFMKTEKDTTAYPLHQNILIENNDFINPPGVVGQITSCAHVTFRNNRIVVDSPKKTPRELCGLVWVEKASDIRVYNNKWFQTPYMKNYGIMVSDENVTGFFSAGNVIDSSPTIAKE